MKCKYCGKNVKSISHFAKVHGKALAAARRKGHKRKGKGKGKYCPTCGKARA